MSRFSIKIAYTIIITGLFVITVFVGLNYDMLNPATYAVLFMLAACVILFGFAMGHNFGAPMKKLLYRAEELSRGRMARFDGHDKDEMGKLGRALNKIAYELSRNKHEMAELEKSVESKVKVRTGHLYEIIVALEQKVKNRMHEYEQLLYELEKIKKIKEPTKRARTSRSTNNR